MSMKSCLVAFVALIFTACAPGNGVKGTVKRSAEGFSKVKIQSGIQATINVGPFEELVIEGDENLLNDIFLTKVEDGTLTASLGNSIPTMPFTISVHMPAVDSITGSGASKIAAPDLSAIEIPDLNLKLSGASSATLDHLSAKNLTIDASGASTVALTGPGTTADAAMTVELTGGSTLTAKDYPVDTASVSGSASSNAEVTVAKEISGVLVRNSQMKVFGNPPTRNVSVYDTSGVTYP